MKKSNILTSIPTTTRQTLGAVCLGAVLALAACGQSATQGSADASSARLADGPTTAPRESLCTTFAKAEEITAFKSVNAYSDEVAAHELAMIQTAVLWTDSTTPVTPDQALAIFSDRDSDGSLGGTVDYFKIQHNGREKTVAKVVYYPGDNEYGALFQMTTYGNGQIHAGLLGTIGDSDVYCMVVQDLE